MLTVAAGRPQGRLGVREVLLGVVVIVLLLGILVGRTTERARRGVKDWNVAKKAVPTGRSAAIALVRRAAVTTIVVGALMLALFAGVVNLH
jgi:hypothetical protein